MVADGPQNHGDDSDDRDRRLAGRYDRNEKRCWGTRGASGAGSRSIRADAPKSGGRVQISWPVVQPIMRLGPVALNASGAT